MKRGSKFLIAFASAAITFGTLTATLGFKRFHRHHHFGGHHYHHEYGCEHK